MKFILNLKRFKMSGEKFEVDSTCWEGAPCLHRITITRNDGTQHMQIYPADQILYYINVWKDAVVDKEFWTQHFIKKGCKTKGFNFFSRKVEAKLDIIEVSLTKIDISPMCAQSSPCLHSVQLIYNNNMMITMSFDSFEIQKLMRKYPNMVENCERWRLHFNDSIDDNVKLRARIEKEIRVARFKAAISKYCCDGCGLLTF